MADLLDVGELVDACLRFVGARGFFVRGFVRARGVVRALLVNRYLTGVHGLGQGLDAKRVPAIDSNGRLSKTGATDERRQEADVQEKKAHARRRMLGSCPRQTCPVSILRSAREA